jgi:hypothetical protein
MAKVRFDGCWSANYNFGKSGWTNCERPEKPSDRLMAMAHMLSMNAFARFLTEADEAPG